jgi:hypothetical protein
MSNLSLNLSLGSVTIGSNDARINYQVGGLCTHLRWIINATLFFEYQPIIETTTELLEELYDLTLFCCFRCAAA